MAVPESFMYIFIRIGPYLLLVGLRSGQYPSIMQAGEEYALSLYLISY